jgi:hypothetical protein
VCVCVCFNHEYVKQVNLSNDISERGVKESLKGGREEADSEGVRERWLQLTSLLRLPSCTNLQTTKGCRDGERDRERER